jgi:hypothetical protein
MPERLIAVGRVPYGRNVYLDGEEFTASSPDAKTLVAIGRAKRVGEDELPAPQSEPAEPVSTLLTRDLAPQADEPPKRKRGRPRKGEYLHRQMRAKE